MHIKKKEKPKKKLSDILNKFENLEVRFKLDKRFILGVPFWDMLRYPLYHEVLSKLGLNENTSDYIKKSLKKRLYNSIIILCSVLSRKCLIYIKSNSILIFPHTRKKQEESNFIDIYTDPFLEFIPKCFDVCIIEKPDCFNNRSANITKRYKSDLFHLFARVISFLILFYLKLTTKNNYFLERLIRDNFGIKISCFNHIQKLVAHWISQYLIFKIWFYFKRPKLIFIVVSQGYEPLIAAAKSLKIVVAELQHGSPCRGKLNYDYSSGITKHSFPDYFLSFGKCWSNEAFYPVSKEKIINFGFPYLFFKKSKFKKKLVTFDVCIISQPVHLNSIINFTVSLSKHFKSLSIIFKPHPSDFLNPTFISSVSSLEKNNITVAKINTDLYDIFSVTKSVIGVYSTAVYEATYFGLQSFVLSYPGYEYLQFLIDNNLATLIHKPEDFHITNVAQNNPLDLFYDPCSENLIKILD